MEWSTIAHVLHVSSGNTPVSQWTNQDWSTLWANYRVVSSVYQFEIQLAQTIFSVLFGLGGFTFGIWRAWRYREKELFSRLKQFLQADTSDAGLASQDAFERVIRPSIDAPGMTSFDTLQALWRLRTRRKWLSLFAYLGTGVAARQHLDSTADSLDIQQQNFGHYHAIALQRAVSARLLCSAIEASTSVGIPDPTTKQFHAQNALEHLIVAKRLPGRASDPQAIEVEINLLLQDRERDYENIHALAQKIINPPPLLIGKDLRSQLSRDMSVGRAHKYQALSKIVGNTPRLAADSLKCAVREFGKHRHLAGRNLLDFAHTSELLASTHKKLNYINKQKRITQIAEICYRRLQSDNAPWARGMLRGIWRVVFGGDKYRRHLFDAATEGLKRIDQLRSDSAYFPPPFPTT